MRACPSPRNDRGKPSRMRGSEDHALRSLKRSRGTGPRATVSGTARFTVGRGPVPRHAALIGRSRGTGPRATVLCSLRSPDRKRPLAALNTPPFTVGRGPVPRDASNCLNQDLQDSRICRILSLAAAKPLLKKRLFRSFRSCMPIEIRVDPFSRSYRP